MPSHIEDPVVVSIRMPRSLHQALTEKAHLEGRTLTSYVRWLLTVLVEVKNHADHT